MKVSLSKSKRVGWMLGYNEDKVSADTAMRIGGNVSGKIGSMEATMNYYSYQRKTAQLKNRFVHLKLSLHPDQKNVPSRLLRQLGERTLEGLGYKNNPFVMYRHFDTKHQHIHIVLSRVTFDGKLVRDSFDGLKLKRIEERLSREFEIIPANERLLTKAKVRTAQKWELERMEAAPTDKRVDRTAKGHRSLRNYIQTAFLESTVDRPEGEVFLARMERRGVKVTRHKFERKGKVYYGLSYSISPTLAKASFSNHSEVGTIAGVPVGDMRSGVPADINHPALGPMSATLKINAKGIPELCPGNTKPVKQLKPVSFRAQNLGPYFMHENLLQLLSPKQEASLENITISRKRSSKYENFGTPVITAREDSLLSSLLIAAEMRSEDRVIEALKKGASLRKAKEIKSRFHPKDAEYIESIEILAQQTGAKIKYPKEEIGKPIRSSPVLTRLEGFIKLYTQLADQEISAPTHKLLTLANEERWEEATAFINTVKPNSGVANMPDPLVFDLIKPPLNMNLAVMDYRDWYKNVALGWDEIDLRTQVQRDTEALADAVKKANLPLIRHLLDNSAPKVKDIPLRDILFLNDMNLVQTLTVLHTGRMVQVDQIEKTKGLPSNATEESLQKSLGLLPGTG